MWNLHANYCIPYKLQKRAQALNYLVRPVQIFTVDVKQLTEVLLLSTFGPQIIFQTIFIEQKHSHCRYTYMLSIYVYNVKNLCLMWLESARKKYILLLFLFFFSFLLSSPLRNVFPDSLFTVSEHSASLWLGTSFVFPRIREALEIKIITDFT